MTFPTLFYEGSQLVQCFEGLTGNHSSSDSDGNGYQAKSTGFHNNFYFYIQCQ